MRLVANRFRNASFSVPIAFAVMVLGSLRDHRGRHAADAELLAMHAPEGLGLGYEQAA